VIFPHGQLRVYVSTRAVDFRKGIDGLALAVQEVIGHDPFCGAAFVFRAKRADRIKVLIWDRTGMVFGAVLEPVAHTPLTPEAARRREVRLARRAGWRDEDIAGLAVGPVRGAGLAAGRDRNACGAQSWRGSYMMIEAFAQIDKEEIDPILSITTKAA
jgi:transposase